MNRYIELWIESLPQLLEAMVKVTLPLTLIAFVLSLLIGILATVMRTRSNVNPLNWISRFYVWVFRGTPLLVQLFLIFYGLPRLGITLDTWTAAIITLSLNTGAYVAETFRASVASIPRGQFEAARTLNFTKMQTLTKVVIPQAVRIALPPLGNDLIDLVKGTALVSTISLVDLFQSGRQVAARTYEPLAMYLEVAFLYLIIVTILSWGQRYLEKRSSRYVRSANA
ncbi:amino acid ABC transporter permease [Rothia terrae]|uniref:Amino acid ABC transporter permease n=1 Tax=Rothia terrae TaxID=396015 RepID=A0A7H2BD49_9MICC|nr:amino acid ABC transporter permease [Rothia terrae]NKZ33669.1 amino acid ABC transporter permease [Rothia terrae]QNV37595.1 amino acid ABC transporter permease [Rothia terrae]